MPSLESQRIRAALVKLSEPDTRPIDIQRREWDEAALASPLPGNTRIEAIQANAVPCEWVDGLLAEAAGVVLYLHGGGFSTGSAITHRELVARISIAAKCRVLLVEYRLAPEHIFPVGLEDVLTVYRWLLAQGTLPAQIVLGGDSAGGQLVMSALVSLRDKGIALPAAAILISPWVDLALTGESLESRAEVDPLTFRADLQQAADVYLDGQDPYHPLASPLFANLAGLPPLLIQVGDHESLLSDATRLAQRALTAGVTVQLEVWPEMWHVWHGWAGSMPEGQTAIDTIGNFIQGHLENKLIQV
jgi:epsilon-lactone hydrolase